MIFFKALLMTACFLAMGNISRADNSESLPLWSCGKSEIAQTERGNIRISTPYHILLKRSELQKIFLSEHVIKTIVTAGENSDFQAARDLTSPSMSEEQALLQVMIKRSQEECQRAVSIYKTRYEQALAK